jgi:arylsulfatase
VLLAIAVAGCGEEKPPSLLLVTIDTLRADHLSAYGYPKPTTPRIDALAASGALFENMMSPLPETGPSCSTLLTGHWPARHGVRGNGKPLGSQHTTLAEILSRAGYQTAGFVSGFPLVRRLSGLQRGFSHFDDRMPDPRGAVPEVQRSAEKTTDAVLAWLEEHHPAPFFLWVHYYDPHGNYDPGPPYDGLFPADGSGTRIPEAFIPEYQRLGDESDPSVYIARYDGEIRRADTHLGRVLDWLDSRGGRSRTLVAITADHGESLTEHGYYFDHGNELYQPSIHIPFILAGPAVPADGRRIGGVARLPDVMPTLLELLGVPVPEDLGGASLVEWLRPNGTPREPREAFSEARFEPYRSLTAEADVGPKLAARDARFTVILRLDGQRMELYDRLTDPAESRDLLLDPTDREAARAARRLLDRRLRARLAAITAGREDTRVFTNEVRQLLGRVANGANAP